VKLTKRQLELLQFIADRDDGRGVAFDPEPRNRYSHGQWHFNGSTFYPLTGNGLVVELDPTSVTITESGRRYLAEVFPKPAEPGTA
jgi:hypothetical protein